MIHDCFLILILSYNNSFGDQIILAIISVHCDLVDVTILLEICRHHCHHLRNLRHRIRLGN